MGMTQQLMTGANKKVYPGLQAVLAWNTMHWVRQQDKEPLLGYYKRFMVAVEHVEKVSGEMYPNKMMKDITKEEARERFLACRFLVAANDRFAGLKKKMCRWLRMRCRFRLSGYGRRCTGGATDLWDEKWKQGWKEQKSKFCPVSETKREYDLL